MSAGSASHNRRPASKPKGSVRAKSGCYTCRIRRKKCDENPDAEGNCQTCIRLRLQCLGFGAKRPDWMREGNNVKELRIKIKDFLAQNGMIKGHSSLRSSATLAIQGESTTVTTRTVQASPPVMSLPPLQSLTAGSTVGLSTPASETSTLTPEERSISPSSPSESQAHSQSYSNGQLPPGSSHPSLRSQHEHVMGGSQVESPSSTAGVLHLSNGRPTPRTRPQVSFSEASRRSHHGGNGYGDALSGTGYVTMDNSLDIVNVNNTRCGTVASTSYSSLRSYSATAMVPTAATSRLLPVSNSPSVSRFSSPWASTSSASHPTYAYPYSHGTSSNTYSNANLTSNNTDNSSSSDLLSSSSSPPGRPYNMPSTTPFISSPSLPSMHSSTNMGWVPSSSYPASAPTPSIASTATSDTDVFSPRSDMCIMGLDLDGMGLTSGHHRDTPPGLERGYVSNDGYVSNVGTNANAADANVKIDPDIADFDRLYYAGNGTRATANPPYRASVALCNDGYATPNANDLTTSNSNPAHNQYSYNNIDNNNNRVYPHFPTTNPNLTTSTFPGNNARVSYVNHTSTVTNSPYHRAPELSPDSPPLSYRTADPMLGQFTGPTSILHSTGQSHSQGNVYAGAAHQATGQYSLHPPHGRYGGIGHGGIGNTHGSHGHSHGQTAASSSWAGDDYMRHPQNQEHLLHQQQIQAQGQAPGPYVLTHEPYRNDSGPLHVRDPSPLRGPDVPPPSVQSSFSSLYNIQSDFSIEGMETLAAQQPQMNSMNIVGAGDAALMSYYEAAPISGLDFYALPQGLRQQIYQDMMAIQPLQPAPADPLFADRGDGSLVQHYLEHVRPVQYFFLDNQVVDLLRVLAFSNEAVRNAICSVASVHKRHMREGAFSLRRGSKTPSPPRRASLALSGVDVPEGDDNNAYYDSTRLILTRTGTERLTKAEAMAGLQCISSFLFAGGAGGWDFFLNIACQWVGGIFIHYQQADNSRLLDKLVQMKREDELGSFIVRTTMWFEVLASVTMARAPRFLDIYRQLFGSTDGARIVEVGGDMAQEEPEFSMLHVMGCDNLTFLALAEISALAAWKEEETKKQTLSARQLVQRGYEIEQRYLCAITKAGSSMYRDRSDSLENRRQLTADIFRASARLYLSTVLNGDKPRVSDVRDGVRETIEALQRVPVDPKSLRRAVVRSVVFPICVAGCMTDDEGERTTLKAFLMSEGGAGNCGSVADVMETVWERRDAQRRGGRRASEHTVDDVSWRDVLREEGKGISILLV